ncbi:MAG TPA: amidohydrolase family protein, partial [Blastocatellia bacterium]|nr:amidohydrolase family protein [Blastocatellia bacterium]
MMPRSKTLVLVSLFVLFAIQVLSFGRSQSSAATRRVSVEQGAQDPAPSPDGKQIAAAILGKIWVLPAKGGEATQLTRGLGWDSVPSWSPDGRFIAYSHQLPSGSDMPSRSDIFIYDLAAGESSFIYHADGPIKEIRYNPTGAELFFLLQHNQLDCHLWRISLTSGEAKPLTFAQNWHEWSFALSPEGDRVLLQSGRYGTSDLYLMDLTNQETRRLTRTQANEFSVDWSSDGRTWAFIRENEGKDTVITEPSDGGPEREVFSSEYDQKQLALFPSGKAAVVAAARRLFRLDLSSGAIDPIPFEADFWLPEQSNGDLAIIHANLFDGTGRDVVKDTTIVIRNGRIEFVGPGTRAPAGINILDAAGKFVLPGLMDNHYHFWYASDGADLLRHGITSIRDPGVGISTSMNLKQAIDIGLLPGPNVYSCGPLIDGLNGYHPLVDVELSKPESAAALVRALKAQGVDAIKVYFMLKPEVVKAVIAEAHKIGLPVTGHIGVKTGWSQAMDAGIDGLNHIRIWKDFLPLQDQPQGDDESLDGPRRFVARMQADWSKIDIDGPGVRELINRMVKSKIGFDPTLSLQRINPSMRNQLSLEEYSRATDSYKEMGEFVNQAVRAGALLLAGTDDGSLFDEMEAYADAGVPNKTILLAATSNGAKWLGKESQFGTVEPGKRADIVIIDGNPLAEIKDMRRISRVIKQGRVIFSDEKNYTPKMSKEHSPDESHGDR